MFKLLIIVLMLVVLVSLGQALFYLVKEDKPSTNVVRALTLRIGASLLIFILLLGAFALGWIKPHPPQLLNLPPPTEAKTR